MRTHRLLPLALLIPATTLASLTTLPAAHAAPGPNARNDLVTLAAGQTTTIDARINDYIPTKRQTRISLVSTPETISATLRTNNRVRLNVPETTTPGDYKIRYRLTDRRGRTDTATIKVQVGASQTDPTLLRARIDALPVAAEQRTGYDRDLFKHWIDADKNGCDTREEILIEEAISAPTVGPGCTLSGGAWFSYYDNKTTTDPSTFDIDHLTPLAEAWDSGAYRWDADTRMRYANDLDDQRSLVAVTASSNRSKSDRDPNEWMPPSTSTNVACRYLVEWVATKTRWSLSIDTAEKNALLTGIDTHACPNASVPVTKATVRTTDDNNPPAPAPTHIELTSIVFDPEGDDATGEHLTFANTGNAPVDLTGWTLSDSHGHRYTFPTATLPTNGTGTIKATTGTDTTTGTPLILHAGWGAVWNNSGDTATLRDPNGTLVDTCTYTSTATRTATC